MMDQKTQGLKYSYLCLSSINMALEIFNWEYEYLRLEGSFLNFTKPKSLSV